MDPFIYFFFNDTATTEIYTLSLHDALPISPTARTPRPAARGSRPLDRRRCLRAARRPAARRDRKSTRLNSSHANISYAVFCLKKKIKRIVKVGAHLAQGSEGLLDPNRTDVV